MRKILGLYFMVEIRKIAFSIFQPAPLQTTLNGSISAHEAL